MNVRLSCVLLLLIIATKSVLAIHPKQDTIYLYHNEMLTGELKTMRLGILTIDTKNISLIDIKVSNIQSINTASDTFRIETADQMIYYGVLRPAPKDGYVYIVSPHYIRYIQINHINSLTPAQGSFRYNLQGNASAGFNYTHSNRIGQLNASANIYYTAKRINFVLSGSSNASIDTSTFSQDRVDASLTGYYNLGQNSKWYLVGQFDYQRNLQLSIARRFQQTAGIGRKFMLSTTAQIMGVLGASIDQERSTESKEDLLVEIPLGFVFNYFKFSDPNMQITSENGFYTSISQKGRIRYDMNTSVSWELINNLYLTWTFYVSYDRKPPDPNSDKTDYGTVVGFTYKF